MSAGASPGARAAYAAFAVFGGFWGVWGASIPAVRDLAGVSEAQLGAALVFVGAGALPAMLGAGRLVDRWGGRATGPLLASLGAAGLLVALGARDTVSLAVVLAVVGATSGATDVAMNATAGSVQRLTGRPVVSRAHAAFSASVVAGSLATGALRALDAPTWAPFALLAAGALGVGTLLGRAAPARPGPGAPDVPTARARLGPLGPLLVLGALGAVAFAVENGHQSWSALFLRDVVEAGPATVAAGPAVFAGVAAVTRLASGGVGARRPVAVFAGGAATAAAGTAVLGAATSLPVALAGLALAAVGTAVLFPTLVSVLTAAVPDEARGRATSVLATVSYLGFIAGPVYVGLWAGAAGLPTAMIALAALGALLALLAPAVLRRDRAHDDAG